MYLQILIFISWFALIQVSAPSSFSRENLVKKRFNEVESQQAEQKINSLNDTISQDTVRSNNSDPLRNGFRIQSSNKVLTFDVSFANELIYFYDKELNSLHTLNYQGEYRFVSQLPKFSDELQNLHVSKDGTEILFWDRGLGKVHKFDLRTKTLTRLDHSFSFRSFYDHGAWVDEENEKIVAMGGYGLFQSKNILLEFDSKLKEWLSHDVTGDIPAAGKGRLVNLQDRNSYLFFLIEDNIPSKTYLEISVFEFVLDSNQWIHKGMFRFSKQSRPVAHHLIQQIGNKRLDPVNGIINVEAGVFYDIEHNIFYDTHVATEKTESKGVISYFFSGIPDKWVAINRNNTQEITYSSEIVSLISILEDESTQKVYASPTIPIWIFITGGLLILLVVVPSVKVKYFSNKISSNDNMFTLKMNSEGPRLCIQDKWQSVVDPSEIRFWNFTHQKLTSGKNRIDLKYFDESVFLGEMHASQLSKKRSSFISSINKKVGVQFVLLEKSQIDKRYKELVFSEEVIKIQS